MIHCTRGTSRSPHALSSWLVRTIFLQTLFGILTKGKVQAFARGSCLGDFSPILNLSLDLQILMCSHLAVVLRQDPRLRPSQPQQPVARQRPPQRLAQSPQSQSTASVPLYEQPSKGKQPAFRQQDADGGYGSFADSMVIPVKQTLSKRAREHQ